MIPNCYTNSYPMAAANPCYQINPYTMQNPIYPCPCPQELGYRMAGIPSMPELPNTWSFGPIKIEWTFDGQSINAVLKMFENAIRDVVLSLSNPTISITTEIANATINLRLNADFTKNLLSLSGAVCIDTVCTSFNNTVIARW